jgi:hypothetical protein
MNRGRVSNMVDRPELWKRELARIVRRIDKRAKRKRWRPPYNFPFERDVLFAACIIRKLIESGQFSASALNRTTVMTFYPARNPDELRETVRHFSHRFQMMKGRKKRITVRDFMNQIIHSYYFSPFVARGLGAFGVFVSSDHARKIGLYYIKLPKLSGLIADYAADAD